jgi:hypothetical protein
VLGKLSRKLDHMDSAPHSVGVVIDFRQHVHAQIVLGIGSEFSGFS